MSNHHHEGDSKSFIMPAFLAFALVFCLFVLMSNCHGPYKPYNLHGGEHATEQKTEAHGSPEHTSIDSPAHKMQEMPEHGTEAHDTAAHH